MRAAVLTTAVLLGSALITPSAGSAAVETCRGLPVTIADSTGDVTGTEGPDVMVVDGDVFASLLGGDDVVCVRGQGVEDSTGTIIETGAGDDVVDTTAAEGYQVDVTLGAGSDRLEGGPSRDHVDTGDYGGATDYRGHLDTEPDVVVGGDGDDWVTSGSAGAANADVIDLGAGSDRLGLLGVAAPGGSITGGDGSDALNLEPVGSSVLVDNAAGRLVDDGEVTARWASMEDFFVVTGSGDHLTFVGTDADESLDYVDGARLTADLGAGDDRLHAFSPGRYGLYGDLPAHGSVVDAGPGRDVLKAIGERGELSLDLRSGRLRADRPVPYAVTMLGFDGAVVFGDRVEVTGTDRANRILVKACTGRVRGLDGDDALKISRRSPFRTSTTCSSSRYDVLGGAGRDALVGSVGSDRLVGGRGRDTADGGRGRARCAAEVTRRCDRR